MRRITVSGTTWEQLLALRRGELDLATTDAAYRLYEPIAGARGSFVLAQVGQSLDGRVATLSGDARDVSGPDGLAHLHRCRALVDAVIVGVGTVIADNPRLSVRMVDGPAPVRVVIDCHGDLDGSSALFHDGGAPVIVLRSTRAKNKPPLASEIIGLQPKARGLDPQDILEALAKFDLHRILVEGGARTIARFIDAGLVDRLHVAVSPIIIGSGPNGISLSPIKKLADAHEPAVDVHNLGSDLLFDCRGLRGGALSRRWQQVGMSDRA
jgi:diaminohydroxyphosphoribosylaminopyrimidine deaminase/5-amino-6-(5-phosphoribosylamino)uracil reductase